MPTRSGLAWALLACAALTSCPSSGGGSEDRAALTWSRSFGGPGADEAAAAAPTADGGFVFAGTSEAYYDSREPADRDQIDGDLWLVKLTGSGDLDWQKSYGLRRLSPAGNRISYEVVRPALDGGFWVGGTESAGEFVTGNALTDGGNLVVTRLDAAGTPLWTRIHDSGAFAGLPFTSSLESAHEEVRDLAPTADGGVVVACWLSARVDRPLQERRGLDVNALWVAKLDAEGDLVWGRHLTSDGDGVEYDRYFPHDPYTTVHALVRSTHENGAFVAAYSDRHNDSRCTRLQSDGSVLWTTDLPQALVFDALPIDDDHVSGQADGVRDDGFLLAGRQDPRGERDGFVARLDPLGSLAWTWSDDQVDGFEAVDQRCIAGTNSCGFVAAGTRPAGGENGLPREGRLVDFWEVSDPAEGVYPPVVVQDHLLAEATPDLHYSASRDEWQLLGIAGEQAFASRYGGLLLESLGSFFLERVPDAVTAQSLNDGSVLDLALRTTAAGQEPVLTLQDPAGNLALETVFPTEGRFVDRAHSVVEVPDGGYALLGETTSFEDGEEAAWLLRVDEQGEVLWQRLFAEVELRHLLDDQRVDLLRATQDGGLVFAGSIRGRLHLFKLDSSGQGLWSSRPLSPEEGGPHENCVALIETADGGFALTGRDGRFRVWVARLDAAGEILWLRAFQNVHLLSARALAESASGLIVAGTVFAYPSSAWVLRLDPEGAAVSALSYPLFASGAFTEQGDALRIAADEDGQLLIATSHIVYEEPIGNFEGGSASTGRQNVLLLRLDELGTPQWYRVYGGLYDETLASLCAVPEGGWLVAGRSDSLGERSEGWLLRVDYEGLITESCNAYLEGGAWPGTAEELALTSSDYESSLPGAADPGALETSVQPGRAQIVDVARQCAGFTPTDGGNGGGGNGEFSLTLLFEGGGSGLVTSIPAGISCRATCSASFSAGTRVVLSPLVDEGSFFSHWEGADEDFGIEGCALVLNADRTVTVFFE